MGRAIEQSHGQPEFSILQRIASYAQLRSKCIRAQKLARSWLTLYTRDHQTHHHPATPPVAAHACPWQAVWEAHYKWEAMIQ